jgi:hypothetical protein
LSLLITAITLLLIWLIGREKPPYSNTYQQTRLDGTFSTTYESRFQRYLDHVSEEIEGRLRLGPISPSDDLHIPLYHPELADNWQRKLHPNRFLFRMKETIAKVLSVVAVVVFADSVSRGLTSGKSIFLGFGTTGLGFRQLSALAFAVVAGVWLLRMRDSKTQTQGYLDGYADGYLHVKFKHQSSRMSDEGVTAKGNAGSINVGALVAWMPTLEFGSPRFVNPWKEARQIVGAIRGVKGQPLDRDFYLALLADRFNWMLAAEDSPEYALQEVFCWLESDGLAETCPDSLENAGTELIINNLLLQERLYFMGVPGELPQTLIDTNDAAAKVLRETTLTQWITALCNKPLHR